MEDEGGALEATAGGYLAKVVALMAKGGAWSNLSLFPAKFIACAWPISGCLFAL